MKSIFKDMQSKTERKKSNGGDFGKMTNKKGESSSRQD